MFREGFVRDKCVHKTRIVSTSQLVKDLDKWGRNLSAYLCIAALIRNLPRDLVCTYRMLDRSLPKSEERPYKSQWNRNTKPKGE